jgi:hypothetical protein
VILSCGFFSVAAAQGAAEENEEDPLYQLPRRQIARTRVSERVRQRIQLRRLERRRPAELQSSVSHEILHSGFIIVEAFKMDASLSVCALLETDFLFDTLLSFVIMAHYSVCYNGYPVLTAIFPGTNASIILLAQVLFLSFYN